jgi:hypothetical protein
VTNGLRRSLARSCIALATGFISLATAESVSRAQTYVCPPPPEGVYGLPGGPKFAEMPLPDSFASQLDDPRWNGAWREDFTTGSSTEAGVRMLKEGTNLFISFEAKVDPDGATGSGSTDQVYLGFSASGTTAEAVKITMTATPPPPPLSQTNSTQVNLSFSGTSNGGTTWGPLGPRPWASTSNVHVWSGAGAGNGDSWAFNAKIDLTKVLGGLPSSFSMWYEIDISSPASGLIQYVWPPLAVGPPVNGFMVATWGQAYPSIAGSCPTGISIDPLAIGLKPVVSGIPSTTAHYGTGHGPNDWVAEMTPDPSSPVIAPGSVKARFRIANWGSAIGMDGDWKDMIPSPSPGVPGTQTNSSSEIDWHCVNPPDVSAPQCYQLPTGAPPDQCLLVELSQAGGSGVRFLHDSARRNMDFVNSSTFERLGEISVRGLTPLPGGGGRRDVYLYVRTLNMPPETNGNPPIQIPPPVPPPSPPSRDAGPPPIGAGVLARDARAVGKGGELDAGGPPPRYRMDTYERYASVMPTYEVHVYHDTGRTRTENGQTLKILESQTPFGYFVQHQGDLVGWTHELTGEGFVLEQISPNFYRAHVPDNGSIMVRTKIVAREPPRVPVCRCNCDIVGSTGWSPLAMGLGGLGASALLIRARRRSRDRCSDKGG